MPWMSNKYEFRKIPWIKLIYILTLYTNQETNKNVTFLFNESLCTNSAWHFSQIREKFVQDVCIEHMIIKSVNIPPLFTEQIYFSIYQCVFIVQCKTKYLILEYILIHEFRIRIYSKYLSDTVKHYSWLFTRLHSIF